jgi:hypothetical protein
MGRSPIGATAMTPAERQRRRRAKLAAIIHPEDALTELERTYARAALGDQDDIRVGVKKLLRKWERQAAANKRWWQRSRRKKR